MTAVYFVVDRKFNVLETYTSEEMALADALCGARVYKVKLTDAQVDQDFEGYNFSHMQKYGFNVGRVA